MINKLATNIGHKLSQNVNLHKDKITTLNKFTDKEIEQILIYQTTDNIKHTLWISLLMMTTLILYYLGIDIRYSTFTFFITLFALRHMFGGYHHQSELVCLIISIIIPISAGFIVTLCDFNIYIILGTYIFAYFTAFKKKTVDNPNKRFQEGNKRLTPKRKLLLYRLGVVLLICTTIIQIFLYTKGYIETSDSITSGVFVAFANVYLSE